jgi:hypothetical protein
MKYDDMISVILVLAAVLITALMILGLFFVNIPENNKDMVNIIVGVVIGGAFQTLYNWRFGSSKGSADKTAAMTDTAKKLAQTVPEAVDAANAKVQ